MDPLGSWIKILVMQLTAKRAQSRGKPGRTKRQLRIWNTSELWNIFWKSKHIKWLSTTFPSIAHFGKEWWPGDEVAPQSLVGLFGGTQCRSKQTWRNLGPLHMSPVNPADSVSEISPHHYFLCKNIDVFIWEARLARLPRSRFLRPRSR